MTTMPGTPRPDQLYRELTPGQTFQTRWQERTYDCMVTDLIRAAPDSDVPWDFRAAVDLASGTSIWLPPILTVTPTNMKAGPV